MPPATTMTSETPVLTVTVTPDREGVKLSIQIEKDVNVLSDVQSVG